MEHQGVALKGWVLVSRTINLGRYNSVRLELGKEFEVGKETHESVLAELDLKIQRTIEKSKIVPRYD
jgi:hypothetical protein